MKSSTLRLLFLLSTPPVAIWAQSISIPPSTGGSGGAGGGAAVPSATYSAGTYFLPPSGGNTAQASEALVQGVVSITGAISNFSVSLSAAPGAGNSLAFTWRKNTTDQLLTCTISGASATSCVDSNQSHNLTVASGDKIDIKMVAVGTPAASTITSLWGVPGIAGAAGPAGPIGPTGSTGLTGAAGPTGATGATGTNGSNGANGAGYLATSSTSLTVGAGSKTFTTQSGLAYTTGARTRAASAANTSNFMEGVVTSYSGASLTINVDTYGGATGPWADWNLNVSGNPGPPSTSNPVISNIFSGPLGGEIAYVHNLNTLNPIPFCWDHTSKQGVSVGVNMTTPPTLTTTYITVGQGETVDCSFNNGSGATGPAGPGGSPGGTPGQIQINSAGVFGGVSTTGSGNAVLATGPTLSSPVLGTATATSVNKLAITPPATGSTLVVPDGVTMTGPPSSATVATLGLNETLTGNKTFTGVLDASGATHTQPALKGLMASKPATCTQGEIYFATDAAPGQNLYFCTASNTWNQETGGGGGSGTVTVASGGNVASTALVTGAGSQVIQTASSASTLDASGNLTTAGAIAVNGGSATLAEGASPSGSLGKDVLFADSGTHRLKMNNNNASSVQIVGAGGDINTSDQVTGTHLSAALPMGQGGTGTTSSITGIARGNGSTLSGSELTGDVHTSGSNTTSLVNIPSGVPMAGSVIGTAIAAPVAPATGTGAIYIDSSSKNLAVKDENGTVKHGIQTVNCSNQAATGINNDGTINCSTVTAAYIDNSVAKTGADINTSNQVTATHLGSALPVVQGGTGVTTATGSGSVVLNSSPTLSNPTLGTASATTVNKLTITAPATGATLTIPDGVTLTGPAASGTAATLGNAETFSGNKTFTGVLDASGASHTFPALKGVGSSKPVACTIGEVYFATDATAGQNLYYCTVSGNPGTWVEQGASGSAVQLNDSNGNAVVTSGAAVSPVNQLKAMNAATTANPSLAATGSDTNVGINLVTKGSGAVQINGTPLAASATTDTTNAANISSGTLSNSRLSAVPNASLANSAVTVNGVAVSLGSTGNLGQLNDSNGNPTVASVATASAVNQVSVTNAAIAGAPSISATGSDTNISLNLVPKGSGSVKVNGTSLAPSATTDTTNAANITSGTLPNARLVAVPNASLANSSVSVNGSSVALGASANVGQLNDTSGNATVKSTATASAVNQVTVANAATAGAPSIAATGTDTNVGLNIVTKGAGAVQINGTPLAPSATTDTTNAANISSGLLPNARLSAVPNSALANSSITVNGSGISLGTPGNLGQLNDTAGNATVKSTATVSAVNQVTVANAATTGAPSISATGTDTNINLNLIPKGSGVVQANGVAVVDTTSSQTLTTKTLDTALNTIKVNGVAMSSNTGTGGVVVRDTNPVVSGATLNGATTFGGVATFPGGDLFTGGVNAQTGTSYPIATTDENKLLTFSNASPVGVTLSRATTTGFTAGAIFHLYNLGAGTVTITPTTSTINGALTLALGTGQGAYIVSDGTNYAAWVSASGGSAAFSGLAGGTNSTAAMVVGSGATLAPAGATSGVISANQINGTAMASLGTGIVKNTTTTGVPSIAVRADFPTLNQDTSGSASSFTGPLVGDVSGTQGATVLGNIPTGTTAAGTVLHTAIAAPSTPAAGKGSVYVDSTSKNIAIKDDAGVVKHGVQTQAGSSNNFVTAISDAGVVSTAQPTFSNLSGTATTAQLPGTGATTVNGQTCTLGASCTIALSAVNAQSGTYPVVAADFSNYKTITVASGTFTITLVANTSQPANGQYISVINYGSGVVTIARNGQTLNGGTASIVLNGASSTAPTAAVIISDGTNYFANVNNGGSTVVANPVISHTFASAGEFGYVHNLNTTKPILFCYDHTSLQGLNVGVNITTPPTSTTTFVTVSQAETVDCAFNNAAGPTGATGPGGTISQIQANGSAQTSQPNLNLKSGVNTTLSCANNAGASSTDCTVDGIALSAVNPKTATYPVVTGDFSAYKTITVASGTFTITLLSTAPSVGQYIRVVNYGSGVVTVAPNGRNINGAAVNLTLNAGSATAPTDTYIISDGTNYFAAVNNGGGGSLPSTVVQTNQANTAGTAMTLDMSASTTANAHKVPVVAGGTAGADGVIVYDSTAKNTHVRANAADAIVGAFASAPTNGHCVSATVASGNVLLGDGGVCGSSSGSGGQTSSYTANHTLALGDCGGLVKMNGSSLTFTYATSPPATNCWTTIQNVNSTALTIAPGSATVSGFSVTKLLQGQWLTFYTDASNYYISATSKQSPFINIFSLGAKGDGSTDDSAALTNAISLASAAGGGTIYFPYANYNLGTTQFSIAHDNVSIRCDQGTTLVTNLAASTSNALLSIGVTTHATLQVGNQIEGCTLFANNTTSTTNTMTVSTHGNTSLTWVSGVHFSTAWAGGTGSGGSSIPLPQIVINGTTCQVSITDANNAVLSVSGCGGTQTGVNAYLVSQVTAPTLLKLVQTNGTILQNIRIGAAGGGWATGFGSHALWLTTGAIDPCQQGGVTDVSDFGTRLHAFNVVADGPYENQIFEDHSCTWTEVEIFGGYTGCESYDNNYGVHPTGGDVSGITFSYEDNLRIYGGGAQDCRYGVNLNNSDAYYAMTELRYENNATDWITGNAQGNVMLGDWLSKSDGQTGNSGWSWSNIYSGGALPAVFGPPMTFQNSVQSAAYKSSDGSTGITGSSCSSFKNGLCVSPE